MNTIKLPKIGVAKIDITPDYPIRLSGYGARKTETRSVVQPIWARCLVIIPPNQQPFILLCVENCGIPEHITETVAQRLKVEENIPSLEYSARKIPPPMPIGTANNAAIKVTIIVPTIAFPIPPAVTKSSPGGSGSCVNNSRFIFQLRSLTL